MLEHVTLIFFFFASLNTGAAGPSLHGGAPSLATGAGGSSLNIEADGPSLHGGGGTYPPAGAGGPSFLGF